MTDDLFKRINQLEDERKAIGDKIKKTYAEMKDEGLNTKALKKVLAERRKPTDTELQAEIEKYRAALAAPGATYRSVAAKFGVSKSKLNRDVPREENGTEPKKTRTAVPNKTNGTEALPQAQA